MTIPSPYAISLKAFVGSSTPLAAADTAAQQVFTTTPTITIDANLTVSTNTVIASGFEGGGGTIAVNNGITLTCRGAAGDLKMFNCIGTGRVVFTRPNETIKTLWFCDPGDGPASFTGSISGTTLTVSAVASGLIEPLQTIYDGSGAVTGGTTIVKQLTGTTGSTGTYQVSASQTVSSRALASAYDCYNDLVASFAAYPHANMRWVSPPLKHHLSQRIPFPGGFVDNATWEGYGTTLDHGVTFTGFGYNFGGFTLDASLNPVPVGQIVCGFEQIRGLSASVYDITVVNFPENGIAFGTIAAVQTASNQVVTTDYRNVVLNFNGRNAIYAYPNAVAAPRSWCNLNHFYGCGGQGNGQSGLWLDGQSIENDFTGFHSEGNNIAVGLGLTGVSGSFLGGDTVTGAISTATGMVSRSNSGEMILYNVSGVFQVGETITATYNGATATITSYSGLSMRTVSGSSTGTFVPFETVTGGTSGATAKVGDWDPNGVLGGILTLYSISGAFQGGETITGGTSGATATVSGELLRIAFGVTGDFLPGEAITDNTSGATATAQYWDTKRRLLFIFNITGTFSNADVITGADSGVTGTINGLFSGGGVPYGGTQCSVIGLTSVTGTFLVDENVVGGTSGVAGRPIVISGNTLGLRGVNPNGANFMFAVGEIVTGQTSGAFGTVSTSELGGGWSSSLYITSGSNSFHGGLAVDTLGERYVIDCSANGGTGTSWFGGRVVGALNGQPTNFLVGSLSNGTHRASQSRHISVDTVCIFPTRFTVTAGMSPITLASTDQLVDVVNNSGAPVEFLTPPIPGQNQQITIQDVKGNAGTFNITLMSGVTLLDTIDSNNGASNVRYWSPTTTWEVLAG